MGHPPIINPQKDPDQNNISKNSENKQNVVLKALRTAYHQKTTYVVLIAAFITAGFGVVTAEDPQSITIEISEMNTFDPICVSNPGFDFHKFSFCDESSTGGFMGISANIDEQSINDNHARILFLKIDLSDIPEPFGPFSTVTISKADLILKTIYEPALNSSAPKTPFYVMSEMCNISTWNEDTPDSKLPCIHSDSAYPTGDLRTFDALIPTHTNEVKFDLKPHVNHAMELNLETFSEQIRFTPIKISSENIDSDLKKCILKKSNSTIHYSDLESCLEYFRIFVSSDKHSFEGEIPHIELDYVKKPTAIAAPLIAVGAASISIFSGVIELQYKSLREQRSAIKKKNKDNNEKMKSICDSLEKEIEDTLIGLKYGAGGTVPVNKISVEFDKDYPPLEFDLEQKVSKVILFTDAYRGILNSGSFENFDKKHQVDILTVYNEIAEHNKVLELYNTMIEQSRLMVKPHAHMIRFQDGLIKNLEIYLKFLGAMRKDIIRRIERSENGIMAILEKEKTYYQKLVDDS